MFSRTCRGFEVQGRAHTHTYRLTDTLHAHTARTHAHAHNMQLRIGLHVLSFLIVVVGLKKTEAAISDMEMIFMCLNYDKYSDLG